MRLLPVSLRQKGFTLIELVTVIVLLGVLAVGIGGMLTLSTQIYNDATNRDELIASGRFAVERINREVRSALPNSVRELSIGVDKCLEYIPVEMSTIYLDIPVPPEADRATLSVVKFDDSQYLSNWKVVVYPLNSTELYPIDSSAKINTLNGFPNKAGGDEWLLPLNGTSSFAEDSPTQRLYFITSAISFCAKPNGELWRHSQYTYTGGVPNLNGINVLMAQWLDGTTIDDSFTVSEATQFRNATAQVRLTFFRNDESVTFNNEVQVQNVP